MNEERLSELLSIAARVASKLSKEYPGIDREDIQSELTVWILENKRTVVDYKDSSVHHFMYLKGKSWCGAEVNKSSFVVCNVAHSEHELRKQLEDCLTLQTVINTHVEPHSESYRPKHNRRPDDKPMAEWDSVHIGTDVKEHVKCLPEEDRVILWRRYIEDDDAFREDSTMRKRLSTAIRRLANEINSFAVEKSEWQRRRPSGYVGARKVISNEHARLLTSPDYGEADESV